MRILTSMSGGMDSTTLAAVLIHEGHTVEGVSFVYGSKHNRYEREAAMASASALGIVLRCVDLTESFSAFKSNLLVTGGAIPDGHFNDDCMKQTIVPGRNLIFTALLAGLAESLNYNAVALGVHGGDHHIYPDCRPAFIASIMEVVFLSSDRTVRVMAPFLNVNKVQILTQGLALHVPYHLTRTCYKDQPLACGKCGSCRERLEAFNTVSVPDPVRYST